jgi:hypothetical protein
MTFFFGLIAVAATLALMYVTRTPGKTALLGIALVVLGIALWSELPLLAALLLLAGLCGLWAGLVGGVLGATWREARH